MTTPYLKKLFAYLTLLLTYLITQPAFADIGEITQAATRADDQSRKALITIFGDVVNNPLSGADGAGTILSSLFGVTNGAILVIGGIAVIYFLFKKITQVAHDGSIYSQNQHTVWGPLRLLFGIAALAPTANGWSLSQLLMLWAASVMGVGSANLATDTAISALANGQGMVVQPAMASTTDLAKQLYQIDLCMHGINAGIVEAQNAGALTPENAFIQQSSTARGFVLKNQSFTCGGTNLAMSAAIPPNIPSNSTGWLPIGISTVGIYQAHQQALLQMQTTISADALQFVNGVIQKQNGAGGTLPDSASQIKGAALQYENTIQGVINSEQSQIQALASQVSDNIKTNGWWTLGAWYQTFAQANTRLSDAVQGKASTFGASGADPSNTSIYAVAKNAFDTQQTMSAANSTNALGTDPANPQQNSTSSQIIGNLFPGQIFVNSIIQSTTGQMNPLIQMKNLGDTVLSTAEITLGAYTVLGIANEMKNGDSAVGLAAATVNFFTSAGDAASGAFGALKPFIIAVIFSLFVLGATLSIYVPMVPFIVWFGAIINWLVVVAEAIIAAPLWALTHLAGDGEGMGHRSAHGWIFLLNVMVRPILMVIGFFLGGAAIVAAGTVLNSLFGIALANVQYDSITGIVSIVTFLVLYCSLCLNLVHSCFNLIMIVPDQVINWVGGHAAPNVGRDDSTQAKHAIDGFNRKVENIMPKPTTQANRQKIQTEQKPKDTNGVTKG